MNISFTPFLQSAAPVSNFKGIKNNSLSPLKADTVQFSGKKKEKPLPLSVQQGVKFGENVLKTIEDGTYSIKTLSSMVRDTIPKVGVHPSEDIKEINSQWQNYEAMYFSHLADDFTFDMKNLYFKIRENSDDNQKLLSATSAAHEYTHACQRENDTNEIQFLKAISKGDVVGAQVFLTVADFMFSFFDNELQAYSCMEAIRKGHPKPEEMKYGQILPKEANVSEKDIYTSLRIRDEKDFKYIVDTNFDKQFDEILPQIKAQIPPEMFNKLPNVNKPERLKAMLKTYLSMQANKEVEAYTTESILAHKITGKDNLSTDIFPIYYKLLAKSF